MLQARKMHQGAHAAFDVAKGLPKQPAAACSLDGSALTVHPTRKRASAPL